MTRPKIVHSKFILLLVLVIPLSSAGQVYTWVDEQGKKHFGDNPPENIEVEEVEFSKGPSDAEIEAAQSALVREIELRRRRSKIENNPRVRTEQNESSQSEEKGRTMMQCAQARQQYSVLTQGQRIFKVGSDWSRTYQDDDQERAVEANQLGSWIGKNCEGRPETVYEQVELANDLNRILSIRCFNAREWLAKLTGEPLDEEQTKVAKKNRDYIDSDCPDVDYSDLWLADWMIYR